MVDFVKWKILNPDIEGIRNLPFLEWVQLENTRTGDIKEEWAKFNGLTITIIKNKYLYISGSLHKYWNSLQTGIEQNYNDFPFPSLVSSIMDICDRFNLDPVNCKIENIEIGVNINPPVPVNEVLRSVINHKGKPFTQEHSENKYFRECKHNRYIIKIYNKGLQFKRKENILRFEVRFIKLEDLKTYNLSTLSDLLQPDKINNLVEVLGDNFNDLLIYDYTIQEKGLNTPERLILSQGQIPTYWETLRETNPDNYFKKRLRFRDLVNRYGEQNIQKMIGNLISQKWNELLRYDPKTLQELTDPAKIDFTGTNLYSIGLHTVNPYMNTEQGKVEDTPNNDTLERVCLTCGKDISKQKPESKFCSSKFVGEKLAHKCRNRNSNPRNYVIRAIKKEMEFQTLFDTLQYFDNKIVMQVQNLIKPNF